LRVFKTKSFVRFARKAELADEALCQSVREAEQGLITADLGGGVIKQRIGRAGQGKSGGFRVLIVFRIQDRAFFVYGFAKNERDNIRADELVALRKLASLLLSYDERHLALALQSGGLVEVICYEQTVH
jgi:hypothetical protein